MITANELKKRGVTIIEEHLKEMDEVVITVRNRLKYVVMSVEEFDRLREVELDLALIESERDVKVGKYVIESAEEHIKRVWND